MITQFLVFGFVMLIKNEPNYGDEAVSKPRIALFNHIYRDHSNNAENDEL